MDLDGDVRLDWGYGLGSGLVASSCKYSDEPEHSGATELVIFLNVHGVFEKIRYYSNVNFNTILPSPLQSLKWPTSNRFLYTVEANFYVPVIYICPSFATFFRSLQFPYNHNTMFT